VVALVVTFLDGAARADGLLVLEAVAVERAGDPHAGPPRIDGARCERRRVRGGAWACVRYQATRSLLPGHQVRRRAWAPLSKAAASELERLLAVEGAWKLPDATTGADHAITTAVYLRSRAGEHRFQAEVALGGPLPDRPQDRVAAAIVQAAEQSGATPLPLDEAGRPATARSPRVH
jgi:hypothetical protein